MISPVAAPWPRCMGTVLPGGFTVFKQQALHPGRIRHHHDGGQATNQIWEFTPSQRLGTEDYCPASSARLHTHDDHRQPHLHRRRQRYHGWSFHRYTNSFVYNPVANTIGTIATIPRATGETRALNFNGKMLVMGGGRTAPNPSNEVDVYDPVANAGR